jgi:hypothetical protein
VPATATFTPSPVATTTADKRYTVLKVTSLADSGPETLRECVQQAYPRVCVFETSGRLKLSSDLLVTEPDLIVVGQTAPSPGIMITNGGFDIETHDVRIEHLAIRAGDEATGTTPASRRDITIKGSTANNIRLKNLSLSWGVDSNVTLIGPVDNVTIQDSIIVEALRDSIHPLGRRGNGVLVGESAENIIFVGNLLAANHDRNIRWKYNTKGEMINNVIFGWGGTTSWNTTNISDLENFDIPTYLDIIGNVYQSGSQGLSTAYAVYSENTPANSRIFISDNLAPYISNVESKYRALTRIFAGPTALPRAETFDSVMAKAGSRPWDRNADDLRIIAGVKAKTLRMRDAVGTWPQLARNVRTVTISIDPISEVELDDALVLFEQP